MPFSVAQKYQVIRYLDLAFTADNKTAVFDACEAVELESEELVLLCQDLIDKIESLETKEHEAFVTQSGMVKADVLEWDASALCHQLREQRSQYKYRLVRMLNLESLVQFAITAF